MSAVLALQQALTAGARVTVRSGQLVIQSQGQLPPEVLAGLRQHRDRLVEILTLASPSQAPLCAPCGRSQHEADYVCPNPSPHDLRFPIAAGYHVPMPIAEAA